MQGLDDTSFERRSGVFALAVSHIVLINMFYTSVGLEHGASKPLLKRVFQGVLRLYTSPHKSPHKTTLMFVIRDIIETTDLETSKPILRRNIQKIWDSIRKPEHHKGTSLSTFFNIEVEGLPNFMERKEQFKKQVKILRQRFNRSIEPCGLAGHSRRTIRGSDFSLFVREIWKTIMEDRELDLPKQEEILAYRRCREIAGKKLKDFDADKERRQLEEGAKTNPATGFGKKYNSIINSYLHGHRRNLLTVMSNKVIEFDAFRELLLADPYFSIVLGKIAGGDQSDFHEHGGFLFKGNALCVSEGSLRLKIIKELHDEGHVGRDKTFALSTGLSSFQIVYGYNPHAPIDLAPVPNLKRASGKAEEFMRDLQQIHKEGEYNKLKARKIGPVEIIEKINPNAYRLKLPSYVRTADVYDKETENYDEGVRSEKREHLKEKMMLLVQSAVQSILAHIGSRTLGEFKEAFNNALKQGKNAKVAGDNCKEVCMKSFDDRCADVIVEQANCNTFEEREKLRRAIDSDVQVKCLEQEKEVLKKVIAFGVAVVATAATGVAAAAADTVGTTGAATLLAAGLLGSGSATALARSGLRDRAAIADIITGVAAVIAGESVAFSPHYLVMD
ncbi:hypothetical protein RHSIM_Rhsim12G0195200 [Rhododendron simsii]|uniref:GB1/RHD3-type G domain-containing protein n=1 Tax=Rhododendron simsii TaxID=118357 RepID=A0A834G5P9_RHOSS|nr:hypothetical protein RHSIM_Rhsim12G0195200 [Rhododendron simsii]